jgi:hypothetical protein
MKQRMKRGAWSELALAVSLLQFATGPVWATATVRL